MREKNTEIEFNLPSDTFNKLSVLGISSNIHFSPSFFLQTMYSLSKKKKYLFL